MVNLVLNPDNGLSVDSRNPAIQLYEKLGFVIVKSEENPTILLDIGNH